MDLAKIIIASKTRNYTDLDAVEIAMAKKLGGGGGGDTGPFLALPKFGAVPTKSDIKPNGVQLGNGDTNIYLAATADIYYFRVGNSLCFACRTAESFYSLFGNGNLRTSGMGGPDSTTGLYFSQLNNVGPYSTVYECASMGAGLEELAQYI